jgi:polyisoprenoid-binding protein YceI
LLVAQIAQSVEQGIENPCVGGSIPSLGTTLSVFLSLHDTNTTKRFYIMKALQQLCIFSIGFLSIAAHAQKTKVHNPHQDTEIVEYKIDEAHSNIAFRVRHLGLSKVDGQFTKYQAKVLADAKTARLHTVEATVVIDSINTGIEKRDTHLKTDEFFSAAQFPQATLKLNSFEWHKDKKFKAKGTLTIRDVSKEVVFEGEQSGTLTIDFGSGPLFRSGFELRTTINRKEFGLAFSKVGEGVAIVSDDVVIRLDVQIYRELKAKQKAEVKK